MWLLRQYLGNEKRADLSIIITSKIFFKAGQKLSVRRQILGLHITVSLWTDICDKSYIPNSKNLSV
jgi:hypothetical protein